MQYQHLDRATKQSWSVPYFALFRVPISLSPISFYFVPAAFIRLFSFVRAGIK